jgi:Mycothiol maleylpyruvate isomerase N-terminal domain
MTDRKGELIQEDDRGWAELRALVDPLGAEQLTRDGYYSDWSIKDLLAHIGCWMAEAAARLEQIRMGTYRSDGRDIDEVNRRWYKEWRDAELRLVWSELYSGRARMLDEWDRLPQVTAAAEEWFGDCAGHYDEHLPRLREWVEELSTG